MAKSLYTKLATIICIIFLGVGCVFAYVVSLAAGAYLAEHNQKLNHDLAGNVVTKFHLLKNGGVSPDGLQPLFHRVMSLNPSIEMYLVDEAGVIQSFSPSKNPIRTNSVAVEPIREFLSGTVPVEGTDPRDLGSTKVFSAAAVSFANFTKTAVTTSPGYLYIVLSGQDAKSIAGMIGGSYILAITSLAGLFMLLLFLLSVLLLFNYVTRRLSGIAKIMREFKQSDFSAISTRYQRSGTTDEIDDFGTMFNELADLIVQQISEIRSSDMNRKELTENIAHDVRRPLTSLHGYVETLLLKGDSLPQQTRKIYLEKALKSCQTCVRFIAELFQLSRLEAKEHTLAMEIFSPEDLLEDLTQEHEFTATERNIVIKMELDNGVSNVNGDIALVERVMNNLLDNAIRHTPEGGTVTLSLENRLKSVVFGVRDSGAGIAPENILKVFNRSFLYGDTITEHNAGLGLAISKKILELHGSTLTVESQVSSGSFFSFELAAA